MGEILAAIVFPIEAYNTVKQFYRIGEAIYEKIQDFRNAPAEVVKIQEFMNSMHEGELRRMMEKTVWVFDQREVTKFTKNKVSTSLEGLTNELSAVDRRLTKSFDREGRVRRFLYAMWYKRKFKKSTNSLDTWQRGFWEELHKLGLETQLPDTMLLSPSNFAPTFGKWNLPVESDCYFTLGYANYKHGGNLRDVVVLIESIQRLDDFPISTEEYLFTEARKNATELVEKVQASATGVLGCLGYRGPPVELIFEVPDGYTNPHSLRLHLSYERIGEEINNFPSREYKKGLAKELVEAVHSVNSAGYVHKNIRPENIVLFTLPARGPPEESPTANGSTLFQSLSSPYLMDWRMFRPEGEPTNRYGDTEWTKNFYRHRERQGLQPQERYTTQHDVYSLGVCLLEIGLWESFIVEQDERKVLSDYFLAAARDDAGALETEFQTTDPGTLPESRFKKMIGVCHTGRLTKVLIAIARKRLPEHMGNGYSNLVIKCLGNTEGAFGDVDVFAGQKATLNFQKLILEDEEAYAPI